MSLALSAHEYVLSTHVRFLRFKGGTTMKNKVFTRLTRSQKRAKLEAVIRDRTKNCLTDEEAKAITLALPLKRQYLIRVCTNPTEFVCGLAMADIGTSKTVLGSIVAGGPDCQNELFHDSRPAAYVTTRKKETGLTQLLQVYIPKEREALC